MPDPSSSSTSSSSSGSSSGTTTPPSHTVRVNKAILDELLKAEQIARAAQKPAYAPPLLVRGILAAEVTALLASITTARTLAGGAGKVARLEATAAERTRRAELLEKIVEMQTAAKIRFRVTDPVHLQLYHVGKNLGASRADLEQFAPDIIDRAEADVLAGIDATKITAARTALTAYITSNLDQTGATSTASAQQITLKTRVQQITDARIRIQLAADTQWPHTNPANAAVRIEFSLSTTSRLKA